MVQEGDVVSVLKGYKSCSFDAVLCDPPYGLSFMGKKWDHDVPSVALWQEVLRVCKPGAPLIAFSGTRTYHRTVVNIEDAGFEIRDCLAWMHGQGFPKNRQTQLKPAFEPAVLARKPLEGTVDENAAKWGCGALAIDACRLGLGDGESTRRCNTAEMGYHGGNVAASYQTGSDAGRWPANVLLDEEAAAMLDEQTGELHGAGGKTDGEHCKGTGQRRDLIAGLGAHAPHRFGDSGGASRFFYTAKPSKSERGEGNNHPTVKPIALTEYLARLLLPASNGVMLVPFAGSGSEMLGAIKAGWNAVLGIEREPEYVQIARRRLGVAA